MPEYVTQLLTAAESAALWLCDCFPGADQHARGVALRNAAARFRAEYRPPVNPYRPPPADPAMQRIMDMLKPKS